MDKRFDDSRWPVVTLRFSEESTNEEWQLFMDHVRACCTRRERFAVIADGSRMRGMPTALQRKMGADLVEWIRKNHPRPWPVVAWANVVTSQLVRGAITAILWLSSPPHPNKVFATWDDAFTWVKAELKAATGTEPTR
jgi:hypothetical protein